MVRVRDGDSPVGFDHSHTCGGPGRGSGPLIVRPHTLTVNRLGLGPSRSYSSVPTSRGVSSLDSVLVFQLVPGVVKDRVCPDTVSGSQSRLLDPS